MDIYQQRDELLTQIGTASQRLEDIGDKMAEARGRDQEAYQSLKASYATVASDVELLKSKLAAIREPSLAQRIGSRASLKADDGMSFVKAVALARSRDAEDQAEGKAWLAENGSRYQRSEKATLGATDQTGGFVIPNDPVDQIIKPAVLSGPYLQLATVVRGINAVGVDIPWRSAAPARAVVRAWGNVIENQDLSYSGYSATLYGLSRIHDMSLEFVRKSAGAAEADAMSELSSAFARGASYYVGQGSGSSEPYGLWTALDNAPATFTTSHTPDADTIAGSAAAAIAKAATAIMGRGRKPNGVVVSPTGYEAILTNGKDEAGFFIAGLQQNINNAFVPGTLVSPWGIPVYVDPDFPTEGGMIVGDFSALKVYIGQDFMVDTSTEAGTRWDYGLVGFRGLMELGCDARPAVFAGAFNRVEDIVE